MEQSSGSGVKLSAWEKLQRAKDRLAIFLKRVWTKLALGVAALATVIGGALGIQQGVQQARLTANIEAAKKEEMRLNELEALKKRPKDGVAKQGRPRAVAPAVQPLRSGGADPAPKFPTQTPN
jgi:hypothetical protein